MATQAQYENVAQNLIATKDYKDARNCLYLPIVYIDGVRVDCSIELVDTDGAVGLDGQITLITTLKLRIMNPFVNPYDKDGNYDVVGDSLLRVISRKAPRYAGVEPTIGDTVMLLKQIQDDLTNLKYDRMTGFEGNKIYNTKLASSLVAVFTIPGVILNTENCCVCLLPTTNTTKCKHHVCLQCWAKLTPATGNDSDDEDELVDGYDCPMCRKFMREY